MLEFITIVSMISILLIILLISYINKRQHKSNGEYLEFKSYTGQKISKIDSDYPTMILSYDNDVLPTATIIYGDKSELCLDSTNFVFNKFDCSIPKIDGLKLEIYGEMLYTKISTKYGLTRKLSFSYPIFIAHGILGDTLFEDESSIDFLEELGFITYNT